MPVKSMIFMIFTVTKPADTNTFFLYICKYDGTKVKGNM